MLDFEKLKTAISEMDDETAMNIINEVVEAQGDAGQPLPPAKKEWEL